MAANVPSSGFNPNNPHLLGVCAKVHRAWHHIQDLDRLFDAWLEKKPWKTVTEHDARGRPKGIVLKANHPIPVEASTVAGDALHNMRSALDHLAVAAAVRSGRSHKGVWFPIVEDRASLPRAMKDKLGKCPQSFKDFVAGLKPYKRGNDVLFDIHRLNIIDKHQMLAPIGAASKITVQADQGFYGAFDFSKMTEPLRIPLREGVSDGDTILDYTAFRGLPDETEITTEISVSIIIDAEMRGDGRYLQTFLHTSFKEVERIVMLAEIHHFR